MTTKQQSQKLTENETQNKIIEDSPVEQPVKKDYALPISIIISAIIIAGSYVYTVGSRINQETLNSPVSSEKTLLSELEESVLPSEGVVLPIVWGDLGAKLVSVDAIDAEKFKSIYEQRGIFTNEYKNLLFGKNNGKIKITKDNSGYLLNLFWALGLASKNPILDFGEMNDSRYGGAQNFASTAGWTISKGDSMDHYSQHLFFSLTPEQQDLVDKVSKGIYRPCCGNSTHFPDCNHGMAMLGLLELMASQGASENDMWETALVVNSYWFPDTYITIATYMKDKNNTDWKDVNSQEALGINYSSAQGYAKIASQVNQSSRQQGGGGCGIDAGETVAPQRQQGGCDI